MQNSVYVLVCRGMPLLGITERVMAVFGKWSLSCVLRLQKRGKICLVRLLGVNNFCKEQTVYMFGMQGYALIRYNRKGYGRIW